MDLDGETVLLKKETNTPAHQVLQKVMIPSHSRSSIGSSLSSIQDQSSEYDTPATSAVATPAEPPLRSYTPIIGIARMGSLATQKRKRSQTEGLHEADALLAQSLQEQEYEEDPLAAIQWKKPRKVRIDNSDDDASLLSEIPSKSPSEFDDPEVDDIQTSANPRVRRATLHSRAVRDNAKKSIKAKASLYVVDSDESGMSDFASDDSIFSSNTGSDTPDYDSEEEDDELENPNSTNQGLGTHTTQDPAAAVSARRRRRAAPSDRTRQSFRSRQIQGMVDRVRNG